MGWRHINHRTGRPRYKDAPSSGRAVIPTVENQGLSVLQLNAEGLTNAKLEVIRQLADSNQVPVVLLQETHRTTDDNLKLPGFLLAGSISSKHHGMATFVRTGITWSAVKRSPPDSKHRVAGHRVPRNNYCECIQTSTIWTQPDIAPVSACASHLCRWRQLPAHRLGL